MPADFYFTGKTGKADKQAICTLKKSLFRINLINFL